MGIIKLRGLVLREVKFNESDKILVVLTKEKGKRSIAAKRARLTKSPFISGAQQFCYCDFVVYDNNKDIMNLNQLELIGSFHHIREDLFKLSYAAYFMEIAENVTMEEIISTDLLKLTLKVLQLLNKTAYNFKLLARIYELRVIKLLGYMPETTKCVNCGCELEEPFYFSSELGGILCNRCKVDKKAINISTGTLKALNYILFSDMSNLFNFSVSDKVLTELTLITRVYLLIHTNHRFKTLEFLEQLPPL